MEKLQNSQATSSSQPNFEQYNEDIPNYIVGIRFNPKNSELIKDYLLPYIKYGCVPGNVIKRFDLKANGPDDFPDKLMPLVNDRNNKHWYLFHRRERKYPNGGRPNRSSGKGYWKATGSDVPVYEDDDETGKVIGCKRTLTFHEGNPPGGLKKDWIMHEYTDEKKPVAEPNGSSKKQKNSNLDGDMDMDTVLCHIYKKKKPTKEEVDDKQEHVDEVAVENEDDNSLRDPKGKAPMHYNNYVFPVHDANQVGPNNDNYYLYSSNHEVDNSLNCPMPMHPNFDNHVFPFCDPNQVGPNIPNSYSSNTHDFGGTPFLYDQNFSCDYSYDPDLLEDLLGENNNEFHGQDARVNDQDLAGPSNSKLGDSFAEENDLLREDQYNGGFDYMSVLNNHEEKVDEGKSCN